MRVVDGSSVSREVISLGRLQFSGRRSAQDIADYMLVYRNQKLAVTEAKRRDAPDTEDLAARCAKVVARFLDSGLTSRTGQTAMPA